MKKLHIGDQVYYRTWFNEKKTATVERIEICRRGEKYGRCVSSCDLDRHSNGVIELDNNHWCYFEQVLRIITKH